MSRETLKDNKYRTIGYIDTDSSGKKTIKDAKYRTCGYYDPKTNTTKDAKYRVVGKGNLLTTLLPTDQY
jgi:hypothetical protein